MVKLPDPYASLGSTPGRSGRPQARIDGSPIAEGEIAAGRAIQSVGDQAGQAVARAGRAQGAAIEEAGATLGAVTSRGGAAAGGAVQASGRELSQAIDTVGRAGGQAITAAGTAEGTAVERGGAQMADAIRGGATAMQRGMASLGEGIDKLGKGYVDYQQAQSRLDYTRAKADFYTNKTILDGTLDKDQDYATLPTRYSEQLAKIQENAGSLIRDPTTREYFQLETKNVSAQGVVNATKQATKLETSDKLAEANERLKNLKQSALIAKDSDRPGIIQTGNELIASLAENGYITPKDAQRLRTQWAQDYATSAVSALPPEAQINLLREAPAGRDAVLDRIGGIENATGDPAARSSTSSAMGNFQFIDKTWLDTIKQHRPDLMQGHSTQELLALRADPKLSREMAGYLTDDNAATLRSAGLVPTPTNLYLAHFLGPAGAAAVLKSDPGTPVADVLGSDAINSNRSVLAGKTTDSVVDWAKRKMGGAARGSGSMIDFIPEEKRIGMLNDATSKVLADDRQKESQASFEQYTVKDLVKNDVASILQTGQGVADLTGDRVRNSLGSKAVADWNNSREDAQATWINTHDLYSLPDAQMNQRLDAIRPKAGDPNFERRQAVYETVQKQMDDQRKLRATDPASSVEKDPTVQTALASVDPKKPETVQALVSARLAAQQHAGIQAPSPITIQESKTLLKPLQDAYQLDEATPAKAGQPSRVVQAQNVMIQHLRETYGPYADKAMVEVIRQASGRTSAGNAEGQAEAAGEVMGALLGGRMPGAAPVRQMKAASENNTANQAISLGDGAANWFLGSAGRDIVSGSSQAKPASRTPSYQNIQTLISAPEADRARLAGLFDKHFGQGSAERYLSQTRAPSTDGSQ